MIASLISNYITSGAHEEPLILFVEVMRGLNFRPTIFTFSILVKACLEMERETRGEIHGLVVKNGFHTCPFVQFASSEISQRLLRVFLEILNRSKDRKSVV